MLCADQVHVQALRRHHDQASQPSRVDLRHRLRKVSCTQQQLALCCINVCVCAAAAAACVAAALPGVLTAY
jgi:hypothetical protein